MWLAIAVLLLLFAGAVVGTTLNFASPFLAIPIALLVVPVALAYVWKRSRDRIRRAQPPESEAINGIEFDERDRRTLYTGPHQRRAGTRDRGSGG